MQTPDEDEDLTPDEDEPTPDEDVEDDEDELTPDEDPTPDDEPTPEPSGNPLQDLIDMIKAIKDKPHENPDEPSLTTWQVDETLDYVEEQLWLIEQAFKTAGIMQ